MVGVEGGEVGGVEGVVASPSSFATSEEEDASPSSFAVSSSSEPRGVDDALHAVAAACRAGGWRSSDFYLGHRVDEHRSFGLGG